MMVKAFDGSKTNAPMEIELDIHKGPCDFNIPFMVDDLPAMFNLLLTPLDPHGGCHPIMLRPEDKFRYRNKINTIMVEEVTMSPSAFIPFYRFPAL